jgi:hypothetical protein
LNASDWRAILWTWGAIALLMVLYAFLQPAGIPLFGDNAMRMVSVEDLLAGQPWQDMTQHRDNVPLGASMHWSRLVDAPIALLVILSRPLAGPAAMEIASLLWPLLLTLPMLALSVTVSRRLVPESDVVTALGLPLVSIVLIVEFMPGRVDHHNIQMVLTLLATAALLIGRTSPGWATAAGLATATSLAIGMETLPFAAVTIATYALLWLFSPGAMARALAAFGATLAIATLLHFLAATPPAMYRSPACDILSVAYVIPIVLGGAGLAAVSLVGTRLDKFWLRLATLAVAGAVTLLAFASVNPACLKGPYAMEELLAIPGYFEEILEAQSLITAFADNWANALLYVAPAFVGLAVTIWCVARARGSQRVDWLILLGFLAAATAILWLQLRGIRFAAIFALPGGIWLITKARTHFLSRSGRGAIGLLVGAWLVVSGAGHYAVMASIAWLMPGAAYANIIADELEAKQRCIARPSYVALAALPAGRVMAPFNLGSNLLLFTSHSIVSAGFHRNVVGTTDVVSFFSGNEAEARRIVSERALDYVAVCRGVAEYDGKIGPTPADRYAWLEPLSPPDAPLQVYRVLR